MNRLSHLWFHRQEIAIIFGSLFLFFAEAESLGFLLERLIGYATKKYRELPLRLEFVPRLFIGLLMMAWLLFWLGVAGLLTPGWVLGVPATIMVLAWIFGGRLRLIRLPRSFPNPLFAVSLLVLAGIVLLIALRPVDGFDALWYHMTIPKLFFQQRNISYLGSLPWFSQQPVMTFYWYLWHLALRQPLPLTYMITNGMLAIIYLLAVAHAAKTAARLWGWGRLLTVVAPWILALNASALGVIGTGYNDLMGAAFGLVAALWIYELSVSENSSIGELIIALLLVVCVATVKIFFTVFAVVLFIYLITSVPRVKRLFAKRDLRLLIVPAILFAAFYLPWIVRSYITTGRLLDPLGDPNLFLSVYSFAGSMLPRVHWSTFIYERFSQKFWFLVFYGYTPLIGLSMALVGWFWSRAKLLDLWAVGVGGFWLVYFASVVYDPRYLLPAVMVISLVTIEGIRGATAKLGLLPKALVWAIPVLFVPLALYGLIRGQNIDKDLYLTKTIAAHDYLAARLVGNVFAYYPGSDSPRPNGLTDSEPIMVMGVHNLAYIPNPTLAPEVYAKPFSAVTSQKELSDMLRSRHVEYILIKGANVEQACQALHLSDAESCAEDGQFWHRAAVDQKQDAIWLSLN